MIMCGVLEEGRERGVVRGWRDEDVEGREWRENGLEWEDGQY